jgi:CTP:molybdopterin cytidylyltransferase MocA
VTPAVAGVVLAAGRAARMGAPKALLPVPGAPAGSPPAVLALARVLSSAGLAPVLVVAAGAALEVATAGGWAGVPGDPDAPMIDSVARALARLGAAVEAAVVQPVDAPFTDLAMLRALLAGDLGEARILTHGGRGGHPVLVPRALFAAVHDRPAGGLRALLAGRARPVPWPDARVLADLDTPADRARWTPGPGPGEE